MHQPRSRAREWPVLQVSVRVLLPKADGMFPEGEGRPRAFVKDGTAAEMTNELLENAVAAVFELWKRRGYDPKKPEEIKARLGYALDRYEAAAYLATGAMHLPLLSQPEAWTVGKRIMNIIGESGTIGKKLKPLRKRGRAAAPQIAALLKAPAALNLEPPPPRKAHALALSRVSSSVPAADEEVRGGRQGHCHGPAVRTVPGRLGHAPRA